MKIHLFVWSTGKIDVWIDGKFQFSNPLWANVLIRIEMIMDTVIEPVDITVSTTNNPWYPTLAKR